MGRAIRRNGNGAHAHIGGAGIDVFKLTLYVRGDLEHRIPLLPGGDRIPQIDTIAGELTVFLFNEWWKQPHRDR